MERFFHLKENGTSVRTEILAGLTTFMTMAYIIALNPNLLTNFDVGSALWNGVFLATCIASAIAMFCMAFLANKPFALAPGMGLNSFFAVVSANIAGLTGMSYVQSFQSALVIILIEGIVFIILSVLNIREMCIRDSINSGLNLPNRHFFALSSKYRMVINQILMPMKKIPQDLENGTERESKNPVFMENASYS